MTAARISIAVLVAAVAGGSVTWLLTGRRTAVPPPQPAGVDRGVEEPPPPPPAEGTVRPPPPAADGDGDAGMLLLPDGSEVAPLNGVTNPPKLVWQNPEWSPIVRTEKNGELDWYVHADGTYSTTMWMWRPDLGRWDATSYSLHPRDPVPTAPLPAGTPDTPAAGKR